MKARAAEPINVQPWPPLNEATNHVAGSDETSVWNDVDRPTCTPPDPQKDRC